MKKLVLGLVTGVVVVGLLVALAMMKQPSFSSKVSPVSNATVSPQANSTAVIVYNDNGFSQAQTRVMAYGSVTFTNNSSAEIQIDSDPHPLHTDNPELNIGAISAGQSKTVKLITKGSFGFHNHLNPSMKARITIE